MSKIQEGELHYEEAQKHLKTGFLKWKPDYESAAFEFEKAATCFKQGKANERAITSFIKAAESYMNSKQEFAAAKAFEQVSIIQFKEMNNLEECMKYSEKACYIFRHSGTPDTATLSYDRTAKMIESKHPEEAARFYVLASEAALIEDRPQHSNEFACKAARLLVRLKKYSEAVEILRKAIMVYNDSGNAASCGILVIHIILLQLAMEDIVSANRTYQDIGGLMHPQEMGTLQKLIQAYDAHDAREIVDTLDNAFLRNLDNEYSKLVRSLQEAQKQKLEIIESKHMTEEEKNRELEEGILL